MSKGIDQIKSALFCLPSTQKAQKWTFLLLRAAIQAENVILFPNSALPLCKNHVGTSTLKPRVPFLQIFG